MIVRRALPAAVSFAGQILTLAEIELGGLLRVGWRVVVGTDARGCDERAGHARGSVSLMVLDQSRLESLPGLAAVLRCV